MQGRDQNDGTGPPKQRRFTCPICKRRVSLSQEGPGALPRFFPFCSERCKLIDLGVWLDAGYRIAGKPDDEIDPPTDEALPQGEEPHQ